MLSFKDIRRNKYHIETMNKDNIEYLQITNIICGSKSMLEELPALSIGLYYTRINTIEAHHAIMKSEFNNSQNDFMVWHERLGHPGAIMMRRIVAKFRWTSIKEPEDSITKRNITCCML